MNLADLLGGNLELFTYADINKIVASLSDEMERIELKREWPPNRELAHDVCAFANGLGGVMIIGYEDPAKGRAPFPGVDGTPGKLDAALGAIQSLTWPSVRCVIHAFEEPGTHVVVVISIPPTKGGPHEYTGGGDKSNLPVRRGRIKKTLSLTEIFALRRSAESISFEPPDIGRHIIVLNEQPATFWGVEFTPLEWPEDRFVFGYEEDVAFQDFWQRLWSPMSRRIFSNGLEFSQGSESLRFLTAVHVDGTIVVVWTATREPWAYLMAMLEDAYGFASLVFFKLGLAPKATLRMRWIVRDEDQDPQSPFAKSGEVSRRVDFARDSVEDVLTFFLEQLDRLADRSRPKAAVLESIRTARPARRSPDPRLRWGMVTT